MNRARSFFYVCLGVLCLAITYHLGARSAAAQAGSGANALIVCSLGGIQSFVALTSNGDVYVADGALGGWHYQNNIFGGGPTPSQNISIGQLKAKYAK